MVPITEDRLKLSDKIITQFVQLQVLALPLSTHSGVRHRIQKRPVPLPLHSRKLKEGLPWLGTPSNTQG